MKLIEYSDEEMLAIDLANTLAGELKNVLLQGGRASFVVPGGGTPGPVFDNLCEARIAWDRVDVFLSDERWLPEVHVRSNARLVKERLLTGRAGEARFHPLYAKADTPEEMIPTLEAGIAPCLPINVLLLGMGEDMHTASLFPGGDNLEVALSAEAPVLVPMRSEAAPEPRVTLSARVLKRAMAKHLVIIGDKKRNALERAVGRDPMEAPIAAFLDDMTVHWAE
ncbi:6-phosphogluconolactonase [Rhodalgimonas zhirmunskyi]|uniref:6-phosphogluconolactonase n=1 Tax=Rhodalgimonas zhirmunskyi TaxID=2964767 RepID=A0AAJ1X3J4_9RHOB|nr:6-phosphogluconolactonase [Rhodoalgimonas zhirmunskyi]MDQ2092571.1 6-phosphogluconolactonase [Rhodoalgimonas zhirmunskyi]